MNSRSIEVAQQKAPGFVPPVISRVAAWCAMSPEQRQDAVRGMLWGYDNEKLNETELVELVTSQHGYPLGQRFIETLSCGFEPNGGGPIRSFASHCVRFGRIDALEQLVETPYPVVAGATILTASHWLDRLCTRTTKEGAVITWTLFQHALGAPPAQARLLFELALKHQADHPQVAETIASGEANASILIELVMSKRIAEQAATDAASGPSRPLRRPRVV